MHINRRLRLAAAAHFFLGFGFAQAAERDYLGWPFQATTFPLCQRYGCKEVGRKALGGPDGSFVYLQLLRLNAKVTLVLAPDKTIMGLYMLVAGKNLTPDTTRLLRHVLVRSANEDFAPHLLPECFQKVSLPGGNVEKRGVILSDNHYGVQCIRKREQGSDYWGVWVFFDY